MDIDKIFEDEIRTEIQEKLKKYNHKVYLDNKDVAKELNISSCSNLRKQISMGKYKGLYEEKSSKKEPYKWNKFKFFKWLLNERVKALNAA